MTSSVPFPVRSATAMPGQTRLPLGARHLRLPLAPFRATTSYAPQMTACWPSPSRSATAGEEYQPVLQYGPGMHPPYCHIKTGALLLSEGAWAQQGWSGDSQAQLTSTKSALAQAGFLLMALSTRSLAALCCSGSQ